MRGERPANLLRNSIVTPSLAAGIYNVKYVNAQPIQRLVKEFGRCDVFSSGTDHVPMGECLFRPLPEEDL